MWIGIGIAIWILSGLFTYWMLRNLQEAKANICPRSGVDFVAMLAFGWFGTPVLLLGAWYLGNIKKCFKIKKGKIIMFWDKKYTKKQLLDIQKAVNGITKGNVSRINKLQGRVQKLENQKHDPALEKYIPRILQSFKDREENNQSGIGKIVAETIKWNDNLYSVHLAVRGGSLETGNHKTPAAAKRAFIAMCNRLGINKDRYEIVKSND